MLNVASLALTVNLKWYVCKNWTSSLKLVVSLAQCSYTKTAQRIFKYSDIQYTTLTLEKKSEQFDIQIAILCQHIRELQTSKNSPVFSPSCMYLIDYSTPLFGCFLESFSRVFVNTNEIPTVSAAHFSGQMLPSSAALVSRNVRLISNCFRRRVVIRPSQQRPLV